MTAKKKRRRHRRAQYEAKVARLREQSLRVIRRETALKHAEETGNVAATCRKFGIDRTTFYGLRKRYAKEGRSGLWDKSRARHSQPTRVVTNHMVGLIDRLDGERPWNSANKVASILSAQGMKISRSSVQRVRKRKGRGTAKRRAILVEAEFRRNSASLTDTHRRFAEWQNPRFGERKLDFDRAGKHIIVLVTRLLKYASGEARVAIIFDRYSYFARGLVVDVESGSFDAVIEMIAEDVLPAWEHRAYPAEFLIMNHVRHMNHAVKRWGDTRHIRVRSDHYLGSRLRRIFLRMARELRAPAIKALQKDGEVKVAQRVLNRSINKHNEDNYYFIHPHNGQVPSDLFHRSARD